MSRLDKAQVRSHIAIASPLRRPVFDIVQAHPRAAWRERPTIAARRWQICQGRWTPYFTGKRPCLWRFMETIHGPPASRGLRPSTRSLSRSLDTIINGESSMFMDVNGGRFSRTAGARRPFSPPRQPNQIVMAGLVPAPDLPLRGGGSTAEGREGGGGKSASALQQPPPPLRGPSPVERGRIGHPPARAEWIGGTSPADDGRGGWDENIACRLRRLPARRRRSEPTANTVKGPILRCFTDAVF
jgi:hypothetical protein